MDQKCSLSLGLYHRGAMSLRVAAYHCSGVHVAQMCVLLASSIVDGLAQRTLVYAVLDSLSVCLKLILYLLVQMGF